MKQAIKYIWIYCAVLLSIVIIKNPVYRGVVGGVTFFACMIIQSVEGVKFVDFIMANDPETYYGLKNYNGYKREQLWEYAKLHSRKGSTSDSAILDNCRRYIICSYSSIAVMIILPFVLMGLLIWY